MSSWRGGKDTGGEPSVDAQLEDLFTKLSQAVEQGLHKRALKCADDVLKISPGDADAIRCRVTALIELQRFADCAATIEKDVADDALRKDLAFERAYALYKCGKVDESLRILQTETSQDERESTRAMQLEAQLMYRAGRHDETATIYEALFRDRADDVGESPNTAVNLAAALVTAGRGSDLAAALKRLKMSPKDSFELAFNFACALLETGNLADAADYLTLAKNQGAETLMDEDLDEEAIADELVPIDAQRARVAEMLGRKEEAAEGYRAAMAIKSTDAATQAIAANNLAALVGPRGEGGADAMRQVQRFCDKDGKLNDALVGKLTEAQRRVLVINRAKALLHSNHLDRCRDALVTLRKLPGAEGAREAAMLEAALFMRERKPEKAVKSLTDLIASGANGDVGAVRDARLALAQIHASAGDYAAAIEALKGVKELEGTAAGAATLVALHELAGDASGADAVLDGSGAAGAVGAAGAEVALRAAERKLTRGAHGEAKAIFESVMDDAAADDDEKLAARAGVALAKALGGDVVGAEADAAALFERVAAAAGGATDADSLEETLPASVLARAAELERRMRGKRGKRGEDGDGAHKPKTRKKRKKKVIYPKGFDPSNPGPAPDPERWLPLRERSTWKGKRKKVNIRGAQGASSAKAIDQLGKTEFSGGDAKKVDAEAMREKVLSVAGGKGKKKGGKGRR